MNDGGGLLAARADAAAQDAYWAAPVAGLFASLACTAEGLTTREAELRRAQLGASELQTHDGPSRLTVLFDQVRSPLLLLLVFAAVVSALAGEWVDASMVSLILLASVAIGYSRE
jgi:Mg2+-importing ATPase